MNLGCRYGQSLALLLPHMEQLLRCVFCWANNCSQRLLTAETTEFYTTFDEILAENILCEGGERINVIRQVLGDCVVEMMLDMFTLHAGPRIRDKLSHGECEFGQVTRMLVNHIICVSLAVVCKCERILNKTACAEDVKLMEKIESASEYYVSKFSSSAVLKRTVSNNIPILEAWKTIPQPNPGEITFLQWHEYFENNNSLLELKICLYNRLSSCNGIKNKYSCDNLHNFVQDIRVNTVYRPKSETIFISLLRRIVDNVTVLCTQVSNVLQEKYNHYNMHKLRTRQRKTYHQILNTYPNLYTAVQCVIILVVIQLLGINSVETMDKLHFYNLSR
ncbi:hypothetical protein PR048_009726 [Dryococelus australis]|uniref:Uncharacterized protein n=1 Tax=Dryococelus australis TaxID=614101 RepID=A0ABQ9I0P7_9NEOP|nr:hypothetical protein PR048_009726 [Dryococelus australis]